MAEIEAKIEYGNLKKLIAAMSKEHKVKVGLLASKGGSDEVSENLDLAGLGAVHEFGATINVTDKMRGFFKHNFGVNLKKTTTQINIPARSWLQMPLTKQNELKKKLLNKFGSKEELIEYIASTGDMMSLAVMLGAAAVEQINEAFETEGWGEWQPDSPITIAKKGSANPLIDTGRLSNAVTYEIE